MKQVINKIQKLNNVKCLVKILLKMLYQIILINK